MKKAKIAVIIIAAVMVLVGCIIAFFGIASIGFELDKLSTGETVEHDYPVDADFDSISAESLIADIKIAMSTDGKCRVAATDDERTQLSVYVENGVLKIVQTDERKWYEKIGIFLTKTEIVIYLPKTEYDSLYVTNDIGDVIVPGGFVFGFAEINTDTGDVEFSSKVINKLTAGTDTGRVTVSNVTCKQIDVEVDTGKVTLESVIASSDMRLETSTGDVKLDMCDAAEIYIKTSTGSVSGTLLSEKQFFTKTSTGRISVPPSGNGGRCEIVTSTGDIRIEIN